MDTVRYSKIAIFLHWLIALLILGQIAGGKYMQGLEATRQKFKLYQLHKSFGLLILFLSLLRLFGILMDVHSISPERVEIW